MAISAFTFIACDDEEDSGGGPDFGPETGCIQGVVVNGLSGERVPIPGASDMTGIHVIVRNSLLGASGMTSADSDRNHLKGEYTICGIPLENNFPLVAWVDGYEKFSAEVPAINSVVDNGATAANGIQQAVRRPVPTELINIALYPVGASAKDFTFVVTANGEPLKDALVYAKQDGSNTLTTAGTWIAPRQERPLPLTGTTNDSGEVVFTGDTLVLGGNYDYTVVPPEGAATLRGAEGTFSVGMLAATANNDYPDRVVVALDTNVGATALKVVGTSIDSRRFATDGKVVVYFNRPIEFVPETKDNITAVLAGANTAVLEANDPGNDAPETCSAEIDGYKLTLTPTYATSPEAVDDIAMTVTYSGISVRTIDGANADEITAGPFVVSVFR
jgi:hypothetical protein